MGGRGREKGRYGWIEEVGKDRQREGRGSEEVGREGWRECGHRKIWREDGVKRDGGWEGQWSEEGGREGGREGERKEARRPRGRERYRVQCVRRATK